MSVLRYQVGIDDQEQSIDTDSIVRPEGHYPVSIAHNPQSYHRTIEEGDTRVTISSYGNDSIMRVSAADFFEDDGSVLSTAQDAFGLPVVDVKDDTLVTVGGYTMKAKVAAIMGYLKKTPSGGYMEGSMSGNLPTGGEPSDFQSGSHEGNSAVLDQDTEAKIGSFHESLGHEVTDGVVVDLIRGDESRFNDYAYLFGTTPEKFKEEARSIIGKFQEQADQYVSKKYGVDPANLWDWAKRNIPESSLRNAMMRHYYGRDLGVYDAIALEFKQHTRPAELPKGVETRNYDGITLVKIPGYPEMSISTAVTMGLL